MSELSDQSAKVIGAYLHLCWSTSFASDAPEIPFFRSRGEREDPSPTISWRRYIRLESEISSCPNRKLQRGLPGDVRSVNSSRIIAFHDRVEVNVSRQPWGSANRPKPVRYFGPAGCTRGCTLALLPFVHPSGPFKAPPSLR